jgi:undecaprenyl-diphosphatase
MDHAVTHWLNAYAGSLPPLDMAMIAMTWLGVPVMVVLVALQWWRRADRLHVRHACVAAGLSFLLGLAVNQVILLFVHRVRPYDAGISHLIIGPSADWSFPSDHATAAFAIVAAFFLSQLRRAGAWLLVGAVLITLSRVYVGTHYVSDVLGGALTGIIAAFAIVIMYREGTRLDRFVTQIL